MENNVYLPDGTAIVGLTRSEWDFELGNWAHLTEEDLTRIRDELGTPFDKDEFHDRAVQLSHEKYTNKYGEDASRPTSAFMLLSVHVKPMKSSSLSVYGKITSVSDEHRYIYKREPHNVERFSDDVGGYLTLNGPSDLCNACHAGHVFQSRELSIKLYGQPGQQALFHELIILNYSENDFEQVQEKVFRNPEISITLKYVSIPMAVFGHLRISIAGSSKHVNMCGKVFAKYKNTFGNYESEEIVLFDKESNFDQFESLDPDRANNLLSSSRCWVVAPVYSLLQLHLNLFDSLKKAQVTEDVELGACKSSQWGDFINAERKFVLGEYYILVFLSWFNFIQPQRPPWEDCDNQIPRSLEACTPQLRPAPAIEVYSVFVHYYKEFMPYEIYGRIHFSPKWTNDFDAMGVDIFKQEKKKPFFLKRRDDTLPVSNVPRFLDDSSPLSVICDLKDVDGGLKIKGYEVFLDVPCLRTQICSLFRGDRGFAALHYGIFMSAVQATLKVSYQRKRSQCADFGKTVDGSISARYEDFDCSPQYKRNWYKIVLFKGEDKLVPMDSDAPLSRFSIPLSRSSFIVPTNTSTKLDLDLMIGSQRFHDEIEVVVGTPTKSIEGEECEVKFVLEWSEVECLRSGR